jgi:hypothetical protein
MANCRPVPAAPWDGILDGLDPTAHISGLQRRVALFVIFDSPFDHQNILGLQNDGDPLASELLQDTPNIGFRIPDHVFPDHCFYAELKQRNRCG